MADRPTKCHAARLSASWRRIWQCSFIAAHLAVCAVAGPARPATADRPAKPINIEKLRPHGQYYQATVPDTLDLAERARLSVHALTCFLNPQAEYAPYGHTYLPLKSIPERCREAGKEQGEGLTGGY